MGYVGGGRDGGSNDIREARLSIGDIAAKMRGRVTVDDRGRDVVRCAGPDHSAGDASLTIGLDDDAPGGFWVLSFSLKDADPIRLKDWVRERLGLPAFKPNGNGHDRDERDPVVATYDYEPLEPGPTLRVTRTKSKRFWQQHLVAGGFYEKGGIPNEAKVPFRLAELVEAIALGKTVYIVEGEKSALALIKRGLPATCSPGGAGKWPEHFRKWFVGARAIVLPDADAPGAKHAELVKANLESVAEVRVINLPGLSPGGDVFDYMAAGQDPAAIEHMAEGAPPRGYLATQLWSMTFPAIKFAVPLYIAEGLTLLAGAPKRGKSWLALDLCVAVARGGFTLGDQHCVEGDVLYCALEDSPRRMKNRLRTVCSAAQKAPGRLTLWFGGDLPPIGGGCEERLEEWIAAHPGARLIVIDTLNYIRPARLKDEDPYSYDYRTAITLQRIAGAHGIAIVLVHHTRKSAAEDYLESISGTNGLTGGCDAVIVLERQGDGATVFKGRGRDVEEFELAVKFDKELCRWTALGDPAEARAGDVRTKILRHMREAAWLLTPGDIAAHTGLTAAVVKQRLFQMFKAGEVVRLDRGKYGLPGVVVDGDRPDE
jgi:hypothetical protein